MDWMRHVAVLGSGVSRPVGAQSTSQEMRLHVYSPNLHLTVANKRSSAGVDPSTRKALAHSKRGSVAVRTTVSDGLASRIGSRLGAQVLRALPAILLVSGSGVDPTAGARCAAGFELLHNPYVDRSAKTAVAERLRNAGCLGRTQRLPQRRAPRRQSDDEPPA
jgi:hypothetical protein